MQNGFVKGIQEVGELFESGELFLPELMMSADAMAGATEVTNAALEGAAAEVKGRIVIGTVQGDVHDIGKAIVIAYLKANGYEVLFVSRQFRNCFNLTECSSHLWKPSELESPSESRWTM